MKKLLACLFTASIAVSTLFCALPTVSNASPRKPKPKIFSKDYPIIHDPKQRKLNFKPKKPKTTEECTAQTKPAKNSKKRNLLDYGFILKKTKKCDDQEKPNTVKSSLPEDYEYHFYDRPDLLHEDEDEFDYKKIGIIPPEVYNRYFPKYTDKDRSSAFVTDPSFRFGCE